MTKKHLHVPHTHKIIYKYFQAQSTNLGNKKAKYNECYCEIVKLLAYFICVHVRHEFNISLCVVLGALY